MAAQYTPSDGTTKSFDMGEGYDTVTRYCWFLDFHFKFRQEVLDERNELSVALFEDVLLLFLRTMERFTRGLYVRLAWPPAGLSADGISTKSFSYLVFSDTYFDEL